MGKKQKRKRKQDDTRKASNVRDRDAQREIARAEKRLAAALQDLDDARAKLTRRESKLADLLRKHGRMPDSRQVQAQSQPQPQPLPFAAVDNGVFETANDARADPAELALAEAMDAQAAGVRAQSESAFGLPGRAADER